MVSIMSFKQILPDISGWKRINDHYTREKVEGMPKITLVIPTCNDGHLLEETIQSYLLQKNVDKELIIVDANSGDHTPTLIEKYKEHIFRVYYVTDLNIPMMVNKGFALARGDYVSFLFPGVQLLNQYCLAHIAHLALEDLLPEVIFSGTYLTKSYFDSVKEAFKLSISDIEMQYVYFPLNKTWLKRGFFPTSPCSIWLKREYIKKLGGINYKSHSLRNGFYDMLCRIIKDKNVRISSTFWSTTLTDTLSERRYLSQKEVFNTWPLIGKHFGWVNAGLWFFRKKPLNFISFLFARIRSFFREK